MNTKKLAILASAIITATCAQAAKQLVDGYTWEYTVANGEATVTGVEPKSGDVIMPSKLGGYPVTTVGRSAFESRQGISSMYLPDGIVTIEAYAFWLSNIRVRIPRSVVRIGDWALVNARVSSWELNSKCSHNVVYDTIAYSIDALYADGDVPSWAYGNMGIVSSFYCKRQFAANWIRAVGTESKFAGYIDDMPEVEIVSSAMRKDDPTVMDVVYKVHSLAQTVKVRAMAWENGERNLSKAIRPTKWIEGTEANIGDAVTANEEHKLSWRIAGDWATDLSKVKLEVLAVEDDLLPLELQTIPATATHQKMKISWNKMTADHVFDALLWLYADGDAGLTLTNGQLKNGANLLASGTSLYNSETAVGYVFGKMGYQKLAGDELAYARRVTQLELPVSGVQQFAVKYPDAK